MVLQKLAEEKRLAFVNRGGALIIGKQLRQLVAKDGSATRFQDDDRDPLP